MPRLGNRIYLIVFITLFSTQLFWLSASAQTKTTENQIVSQTDNLAYRIFLMNNNTKAAYDLAKKNVKQHPNNLLWLRRLAKTAGWMGKTREALDLWYELAQKEKSPRLAAKEALKLAIAIRDHTMQERIYRLLIQRGYNNRKNWESLANAQEQQGQTTNAINTLRNLPASLKHPSQQLLIAKIKQQAGQSEQAAAILEQHQQRFGRSFELTLQQAGNSFQRGKINTAYQQLLSVKAKAPATENLYWQMLGDAAWYLQDAKQAAQAYRYLYVNGKIDESRLLRLINATEPNHPKLAFKYATQGWQRYHTRPFIILVLSSGVNSGQYDYIDRFIQQLPTAELTHLKQSNFYWYLRAKLFERQKRYRQAQAVYEQAIRRFPNNLQMKADLLWLLIDTNNKTELAKYLLRWQYMLFKTSLLQPAFAVAYDKLGRPDIAIMLFRRIYQANKMDPIWLLNFADVLERHNDHYAARFLQDRAWQLMAKQYHKNGSVSESNTLSDKAVFANLSPRFLPADNTAQMMAYLSNKRNVEALNAMTTWAIDIEHAELAVAVEQYALHDKIRIPTWSQLSVALLRNDQPKIYTMIK